MADQQEKHVVDKSELCKVCQRDLPDRDDVLVLCDGCDAAFHTFCFKGCTHCNKKPPGGFGRIPPVPTEDWYCKFCRGRPPLEEGSPGFNSDAPPTFAFGNNEGGQLGLGQRKDDCEPTPVLVEDLKGVEISNICLGGYNSLFLSKDSKIYTCGDGYDGKTGHIDIIHERVTRFRLVEPLLRENVTKNEGGVEAVGIGDDFSIAISSNGHAYTWGCGESGKLGHQEMNNKKQPKKISALRENETPLSPTIGIGAEHVLAVNYTTGELLSWGLNTSSQLGLGSSSSSHWVPKVVNPCELTKYGKKQGNCPIEDPVLMISCGKSHSLVLAEGHQMYSCGNNVHGQLGYAAPESKAETTPDSGLFIGKKTIVEPNFKLIEALVDVKIAQIEAGGNFSLVLTSDGFVYSFGQNNKGQLGLGKMNTKGAKPTKIPTLKNIVQIGAGADHAAALSVSGVLYTWGHNHFGQLGHGNTEPSPTPKAVALPKIGRIFCGGNHTFAIGVSDTTKKRKHSSGKSSDHSKMGRY